MSSRKVVLAGNNDAAVFVLELLLQVVDPADILALAPPQDARSAWQTSLAEAAHRCGVRWIAPEDVNAGDTLEHVRAHAPELLLSVYYTQLFSEAFLGGVSGTALNFHPSLLPRHRGHAPIVWAVASGDEVTGLSVHRIDSGVDTGPLLYQLPLPIHPLDTGYDVHRKMSHLVAATASDLIRRWIDGRELPPEREQTGEATTHTRRDPQLNHLDWRDSRERIRNVVRALAPPLPGAFVRHHEQQIVLVDVAPVESLAARAPGMVDVDGTGSPIVWASNGPLQIIAFAHDGGIRDGRELRALGIGAGTMFQ